MHSISCFTFAVVLAGLLGTARSSAMDGEQISTDYVGPMLKKHCEECHSHSAKKIKENHRCRSALREAGERH